MLGLWIVGFEALCSYHSDHISYSNINPFNHLVLIFAMDINVSVLVYIFIY